MKNIETLDVLVVYSPAIATSASTKDPNIKLPFTEASGRMNYNNAYEYFLTTCSKLKIRAGFTTSSDLTSQGDSFNSYWVFKRRKWIKVNRTCKANIIFDKFSPVNATQSYVRETLFSNIDIKPFNNPDVYLTFFDKLKTYERLSKFTIPTVELTSKTKGSVSKALKELQSLIDAHEYKGDFSTKIVVKDRFGSGGRNIFEVRKNNALSSVLDILKNYKETSFVLQPFTKFSHGFSYKSLKGFIDIRVIYLKNKIVQVYLRIAKEKDFRCNEHRGGTLEYIPLRDLPKNIRAFSREIIRHLDQESSLFSLDFVVSDNGKIYLMEGNCGPGLDWNLSLKKNEIKAKHLIQLIVKDLAKRVKFNKTQTKLDKDISQKITSSDQPVNL